MWSAERLVVSSACYLRRYKPYRTGDTTVHWRCLYTAADVACKTVSAEYKYLGYMEEN